MVKLVRSGLIASSLLCIALTWPATGQHAHDPGPIQSEHAAAFELVPYEAATHWAVHSGSWGDPATWDAGEVPTDGARVVVGHGVEVVLDYVNETVHRTIRIDGTLRFATDVDTSLSVDTLVVDMMGHLQIGTVDAPVAGGVNARLIIADTGPIDTAWDPNELSRGLISHGRVTIHGEAKASHLDLLAPVQRRDRHLLLAEAPLNWHPGDVLVLPGTHPRRDFDETLLVVDIDGNRVEVAGVGEEGGIDPRWRGLSNRHGLSGGVLPFVINVSRNVAIVSENVTHSDSYGINRRRGHVMFMHSGVSLTDARYVGVYGLGRTDKRTPLESPEVDMHGQRVPERGHNAVGRYAWHFHRGGPTNGPAVVQGLAIVDSPGLGLVNHSSNVEVTDSVAFNVVGSAWFTEAGNETGFFQRVAAVRMPGSGESVGSRSNAAGVVQEPDFGHAGHGFWLQGGGVSLHDVRVAGAGNAGIIFFTQALNETGLGPSRFDAALLDNPEISNGSSTVPVGVVPLFLERATVFGSVKGVETKFHQLSSRHQVPSIISQVTTAATGTALSINYTNQLHVENSVFLGNLRRPSGRALARNGVTRNITFDSLVVRGWYRGLDIPIRGTNRVLNGVFQNVQDIIISTTRDDDRLTLIDGDIEFLDVTEAQRTHRRRGVAPRHRIRLVTRFNPKFNDITRLFARDIIRLGTVMYEDKQLFYHAQAADFVPFQAASAADYVPTEFIDRTNAEMWRTYGLSIGDGIAPEDAFEDERIHALIGEPITYPPKVRMRSRKYTKSLSGYRLRYLVTFEDGTTERRRPSARIGLIPGWNILPVMEGGFLRSHLVFGDIVHPEFEPSPKLPMAVNPLDLRRGFRIVGQILDNSFGIRPFKRKFSGRVLTGLPILERADGSSYVELAFPVFDFARNRTNVVYALDLVEDEPLAHVKSRRRNRARPVARALHELLDLPE